MSEQQFSTKLRDILAYLYPEEADARRVVNDADMDVRNIAFSTKAINNWTTILLQAQKEHKTANLMVVTFRDYKENEKLSKGWHDYLVTMRNREVIQPTESTMSNGNTRWPLAWIGLVGVIFISIGILLRWPPSVLRNFVFPTATTTSNSAVFQPTDIAAISPTERKPIVTFTASPEATETSTALGIVSISPTLTPMPLTDTITPVSFTATPLQVIDISTPEPPIETPTSLPTATPVSIQLEPTTQLIVSCERISEIPDQECNALAALYESTGRTLAGWFSSNTPCNWDVNTVKCNENLTPKRITDLRLSNKDLNGIISPEICRLEKLQTLNIISNVNLRGEIPECLIDLAEFYLLNYAGSCVIEPTSSRFQQWLNQRLENGDMQTSYRNTPCP